MNVIVSNKQKMTIDNANIDAIKDLNGLFNVDDLVSKFQNYYFSKMVLDATSIVDFTTDEVLNKLVEKIGSEKLFILLPPTPEPPKEFVDKLIGLGIYNFSNKIEDIVKYLDNPNTFETLNKNDVNSDKNNYEEIYTDNSLENEYQDNDVSFSSAINNIAVDDIKQSSDNEEQNYDYRVDDVKDENKENVVNNNEQGINQLNENDNISLDVSNDIENNNENNNIDFYDDKNDENNDFSQNDKKIIIGFKNVTAHAGSTTLIYLLLNNITKKRVSAMEINRDDFKYFQNNRMISVNERDVNKLINQSNDEIILVDLNNCQNTSFCNEILYLVEPSIIKLNKLMMENRFAFKELQYKKIVLNKSLLSNSDVSTLSKEAGVTMFFNMPPVNDRINNSVINNLIKKLDI